MFVFQVNLDTRQKNALLKRPGVQGELSGMQEQQQQPFLHQPLQGQPQSPQGQPPLQSQPPLHSRPPLQSQPSLQSQPPLQSRPPLQSQPSPLQDPQLQRQQTNQQTLNQQFSSTIPRRSSMPPNFQDQGSAGYIPQYPSGNSDFITPQKKKLVGAYIYIYIHIYIYRIYIYIYIYIYNISLQKSKVTIQCHKFPVLTP